VGILYPEPKVGVVRRLALEPCEQLVEALKRLRRERAGGTEGVASGRHNRLSSLEETEPLALTNG
jgi:hypothetical protein